MIYKVIIEPEAFQDLLNIKSYITKEDTLNKANQFISQLKKSIKSLDEMPQRCRKSYYTDTQDTDDLIYKNIQQFFKLLKKEFMS